MKPWRKILKMEINNLGGKNPSLILIFKKPSLCHYLALKVQLIVWLCVCVTRYDCWMRLKLVFMCSLWNHLTNVYKSIVTNSSSGVLYSNDNDSLAYNIEKDVEAVGRVLWPLAMMTLCPFQIESLQRAHICSVQTRL